MTGVMLVAGLTWGGMVGWAARVPETQPREWLRTAAFAAMIAAASLYPIRRTREADEDEETL